MAIEVAYHRITSKLAHLEGRDDMTRVSKPRVPKIN
jgi:hypothetical protein